MTKPCYDSVQVRKRLEIARKKASDALYDMMENEGVSGYDNLFPAEKFVSAEYHDLRWGWYYILTNKDAAFILTKVSYSYSKEQYTTEIFMRKSLVTS